MINCIPAERFTTPLKRGYDQSTSSRTFAGNLYLTSNGVTVFDKTGKKIAHIDVPEPWSANFSFGGKDHQKLSIKASKGLYSVRLKYRGAVAAK